MLLLQARESFAAEEEMGCYEEKDVGGRRRWDGRKKSIK